MKTGAFLKIITTIMTTIIIGTLLGMLIVLILFMTNDIRQGTIIDKKYTSEVSYTEYHIRNDEIIPYQRFISEKYYIKIQKEQKSTWIEIPKEEYNNLNIGDSYGNYKEE